MLVRIALLVVLALMLGGNAAALDEPFLPQAQGVRPGDIYTINADGTGRTNLTNSKQDELSPAWSPDRTRIAFIRYQGSNQEIWVMNADGSGQVRITSGSVDESPRWSPDGSEIAFSRRSDYINPGDIFVMKADGSGQTNLTNESAYDESPDWSPDGSRIVYSRSGTDGSDIYVMNADGSGQTDLTADSGLSTEIEPRWSPDGTRIAYAACCPGGRIGDIYVMNADGTGLTDVTPQAPQDFSPSWAGDSSKIVLTRWADGTNYELYAIAADGSGEIGLTNTSWAHEFEPDWSRDGTKIAFVSGPPFHLLSREVFRMNADGSGQTDLTNSPWTDDFDPSWAPQGDRIAYASKPVGYGFPSHIYVMRADGSGPTQLTTGPSDDRSPDWSPDGQRIVFERASVIYVMNADGTGLTSLGAGTDPAWSPDGSRIAIDGSSSDGISALNADGSGRTSLTGPCECYSPAWSPDGSRIAFFFHHSGPLPLSRFYVMDSDGSNWTELPFGGGSPAWSPDGTKIAVTGRGIFVMGADGSDPVDLSNYRYADDKSPDWSRDGGSIAFDTYRVPDGPAPATPLPTPAHGRYVGRFAAPACFVPRVIGLRLASAAARIGQHGCRVGRVRRVRSKRVGRVITQNPRAAFRRAFGTKVDLVIGRLR